MAPRAEGLLEEAQKEAEEVVAEAEVISLLGEWMLGTCYSISLVGGLLYLKKKKNQSQKYTSNSYSSIPEK